MKQTVTFYTFTDAFRIRPENFSYEALQALWEHLKEWEEDTGEELELDPIAFCCDFAEDTAQDIAQNYGIDISEAEDEEGIEDAVKEYLLTEGHFIAETERGFLYRSH